ncbi:hypothetical protein EVAR_99545_1 [Eumeta japonica]|uniref:PDZ domain-containing protein n=1 Tax=Eumeta variegata TaxID=151549 RepID=A0A4C1YWL2_EUMVA|nr:hypothetical protein EVAR_99545_1 [Eumeta japonica]
MLIAHRKYKTFEYDVLHLVTIGSDVYDCYSYLQPGVNSAIGDGSRVKGGRRFLSQRTDLIQDRFRPRPYYDPSTLNRVQFLLQGPQTRRVKLWARDFAGLGLRCGGGARGIVVHSVLKQGPAAAAGIKPGDRIKSIKVEFTGTPLEDAVGIISLASPYPVELEVTEGGKVTGSGRGVQHPLLRRAGSTGDVNTLSAIRQSNSVNFKRPCRYSYALQITSRQKGCARALGLRNSDVMMISIEQFKAYRIDLQGGRVDSHYLVSLYHEPHRTEIVFDCRRRRTSLTQIVSQISATTFELFKPFTNSGKESSFIMKD